MNRFVAAVELVAAAFMFLVALGVAVAVAARRLLDWTPPDYFDLARLALGIALCWGIASACYRNRHIMVDIVHEWSGPRGRRRIDLVATAIVAVFMAALSWMLGDAVLTTREGHVLTAELRLPVWIFHVVAWAGCAAGFAMSVFRFVRLAQGRDTADR